MSTRLGKLLRIIRVEREELLYDMAKKLGVSSAFLSKVENGKSKPPKEWKQKIAEIYNFQNDRLEELDKCFYEALNSKSLDMSSFKDNQKELVLEFARKIEEMDKEKLLKIKKAIEE